MGLRKIKELGNIQKIGVIMFGILGDVLVRTPLIRALNLLYPKAEIVVISDLSMKVLFENNQYVTKMILFDRNNKSKIRKNMSKLRGALKVRSEKFDLLVDLYNGGSSPFLVSISGAKHRLGYTNKRHKNIYNLQSVYLPEHSEDVESLNVIAMHILKPITDKEFDLRPIFQVPDSVKKSMHEYLLSHQFDYRKLYTLNLGSGGEDKLISKEMSYEVVKYIYEKYGFIPAIVSNPGQEHLQENFIDYLVKNGEIPYIKLKSLSLTQIASIIELTTFIITPDTGLMHIAMAVDSYIYAIFTYSNPDGVEGSGDKIVTVYEHFPKGVMYQQQDIKISTMREKVDILFNKLNL